MFRLLRLKPPNGWSAVGWELAIVTVGIIIALGVQQWANEREWRAKARNATAALKEELAVHYFWSIEWRSVEPCVVGQIDRLQKRLMASGDRLNPAPVYSEPGFAFYVVRLPLRAYETSVWEATLADGVRSRLEPKVRRELGAHYAKVAGLTELGMRNNVDTNRLLSLGQPMPLDPAVRFSLVQTLNELRGRAEHMSFLSSHLIDHITRAGLAPPRSALERGISKTAKFCLANQLPIRR